MGMTWLAFSDGTKPVFSQAAQFPKVTNSTLKLAGEASLGTGSLIIETAVLPSATHIQKSHALFSIGPLNQRLSLSISELGGARLELRVGDAQFEFLTAGRAIEKESPLRITFSWDYSKKISTLSVENLARGTIQQSEFNTYIPMPKPIIETLMQHAKCGYLSNCISFIGASEYIEPVGFLPSIAHHSPVDTPTGPTYIEDLKIGDLVTTIDHGPQPIRWICKRDVPTRGQFQPLRLRAPYFGLSRDILVAPEQRILFESSEIEYLFGEESVLVEARHLINPATVRPERTAANSLRFYHLLFDQHDIISVAGAKIESLFIGNIADCPDILQSTLLQGMSPAEIPRHKTLTRPLLRAYEAATLLSGIL